MTNTFILGVALVILTCSINIVQNISNFEAKVDEFLKEGDCFVILSCNTAMTNTFTISVVLTILTCNIVDSISNIEANIDDYINEGLKCHTHNPGVSVAVVKDGKVLMTKGYGMRDVSTKAPVTDHTLFGIASMSKAFCATLLVKLLSRNANQSIYTHVKDILPNFKFTTHIRTDNGNIRDLLSHTMGFPSNNMMRLDPKLTRNDIARRAQMFHAVYPFRESYLYNNFMYGLASVVAEKLGGKSWEDLISEELYQPLGMTTSSFMTRVDLSGDVAKGYTTDDATGSPVPVNFALNRRWGQMGGSTNCMSNAVDISKWMLFHLNKGRNQAGQQIMTEDDIATLHKRRNTISAPLIEKYFSRPQVPVPSLEENYALGWKNGVYRGYKVLRHTGSTWGYSSLVTLIPDMNIGIFTTMNGNDPGYRYRFLLHNYIGDFLLGEHPWLNKTTLCTFPEPWYRASTSSYKPINKNIHPTRSLVKYEGVYHNDMYGNLHVFTNTSTKTLQMNYGIGSWLIYPTHTPDTFVGEGSNIVFKTIDLSSIKFHHATHDKHAIDRVQVPSFEKRQPPTFIKTSSHVNIGSIIG